MGIKEVFVLGTSEYSFMISKMIEEEEQYKILGHTCSSSDVSTNYYKSKNHGRELFAFENLRNIETKEIYIINAVGYSKMNQLRMKMSQECLDRGYIEVNYISRNAIVLSEIKSKGNIVLPGAFVGMNVELGDNNVVYSGVTLTHDIRINNNVFIAAGSTVGGFVDIGDNCFIGMNSTIKNRVNIAEYTLVGAGAYISQSTNKYSVFVPEKSVKLNKNPIDLI